ncbi:hypothetical protein E1295_01385 [Nonomuraea mesophila]|uniref:Uncharacterized protein n=1 Tax=Nonomuraea mesophila TaxID=2530382 RepID=A0A4R5FXW9_9ACTN|nr:hypothetical protein E1295_01385 [Nonomuraea mesophila]
MRCHSGEASPPANGTSASAAWMFAGSIATNSSARQAPAAPRVRARTSPAAPASSSTPVR